MWGRSRPMSRSGACLLTPVEFSWRARAVSTQRAAPRPGRRMMSAHVPKAQERTPGSVLVLYLTRWEDLASTSDDCIVGGHRFVATA